MAADRPLRLMVVAGEASGDLHGSHLIRALRERVPGLQAFGFGGDLLAEAGVELAHRMTDHQAIGYAEVIRSVPVVAYQYFRAVRMLTCRRPDTLLVIDFPTFNLPLAERARRLNIPVHYFIPPKVWGWKKERAKRVARAATKIFTIFPFENEHYLRHGGRPFYFGHPLVDFARPLESVEAFRSRYDFDTSSPLVCLLPGSRPQEIRWMLRPYLEVARKLKTAGLATQFALPRARTVSRLELREVLDGPAGSGLQVRIVDDDIHSCLAASQLALATCGTVTLQAALCNCPMIISYNAGRLTRWLFQGKHGFQFFGLPNIAAGREICPERVGDDASPDSLFRAASGLLGDPAALAAQRKDLSRLSRELGDGGVFGRVADEILETRRELCA